MFYIHNIHFTVFMSSVENDNSNQKHFFFYVHVSMWCSLKLFIMCWCSEPCLKHIMVYASRHNQQECFVILIVIIPRKYIDRHLLYCVK